VGCSVADTPSCAVVIPAFNEEATVADVVRVARRAALGPVVVVDDGSEDRTAAAATAAGAQVLRLDENHGKGGAVAEAARRRDEAVLVLLDADLTGLRPQHVRDLAAPVLRGEAEMTRGVFIGGRWSTAAAQQLIPQLNGQRGVLRSLLLEVPGLAESRYGIEVAITDHAKHAAWRTADVPLPGVSQVMKEEKRGLWRGVAVRARMYGEIVRQLFRTGKRA
jgi:glycosyltransferase involved in cell wall biosynthesis